MTLTYELDLDILKMYLHTKMNLLDQGCQKLEPEQDKQTQIHTDETRRVTMPLELRHRCLTAHLYLPSFTVYT